MVGVPKSLGCTGCKQQKKKCVGGPEPPCDRCKRLDIPCVGLGQRKFKFHNEGAKFAIKNETTSPKTSTLSKASATANKRHANLDNRLQRPSTTWVPMDLSNGVTALANSYTYSISDPTAETNFGLVWSFGSFLSDIPAHLGRNEALDAAVDGLAVAYGDFRRSGRYTTTALSLRKYSKALESLRNYLTSADKARETETLCAIMILMISETLMGTRDTRSLKHCEGAARIFKCRGLRPPSDELERKLLLTLRGPVVVQAMFVDTTYFSDEQWSAVVAGYSLPEDYHEDSFFPFLAATVRLFQRARKALSQNPISLEEIEELQFSTSSLRKSIVERTARQTLRVAEAKDLLSKNPYSPLAKFNQNLHTRDYGMGLVVQVQVNHILAALDPTSRTVIEAENIRLCHEMCNFAETEGPNHRPLGALYIRIMLQFAYNGAGTDTNRARVQALMREFTSDYMDEPGNVPEVEQDLMEYFRLMDINRELFPAGRIIPANNAPLPCHYE